MSFFKSFTRKKENPVKNVEDTVEVAAVASDPDAYVPVSEPPLQDHIRIELADDYDLEGLLRRLVQEDGSDLHLAVGMPPIFRIHGDLYVSQAPVLTEEKARELLFPLVDETKIADYEKCGNLDFAYEIPGLARFRANYFRQNWGMAAVFRVIPSRIPSIDELHLPPVIKDIAMMKNGIVLVTGPTGSGKSTTLASMIDYVNHHRRAHIITIEDPIEFTHTSDLCLIDHREVGTSAHSFADAIRASLREDPDIILVGEMRDLDTIYNAIKAAETGALVFATLHTNSASKTIDRIIDVFPAKQQEGIRAMLSESFKAVIAQQLLKKEGGGRVAVHEILVAEAGFSNLIREGKTSQINNYIQTGKEFGMQSMDVGLMQLYRENKISKATVRDFCIDPNYFRLAGVDLSEV